MAVSLKTGAERLERLTVDRARTIGFLGEDRRVYSTPAMVSDIEYACYRLIREHLQPDESSLGIHVSVDHLGPTPLGAEVTIRVRVSCNPRVTAPSKPRSARSIAAARSRTSRSGPGFCSKRQPGHGSIVV